MKSEGRGDKGTCVWLGEVCLQFLFTLKFIHQQHKVIQTGQPFSNWLYGEKSYSLYVKKWEINKIMLFLIITLRIIFLFSQNRIMHFSEWFQLYLLFNPFKNFICLCLSLENYKTSCKINFVNKHTPNWAQVPLSNIRRRQTYVSSRPLCFPSFGSCVSHSA